MTDSSPLETHLSMYTHEYMVMKPCRHGTLLFNQQDTFVGRSLDLYGEWCEAEIDLLAQVLKPGDVVHQCSHHAPRDEPGLVHVVMVRPLAIVASGWRILFERLP
jgi:hypothetical protein